MKAVWNGAVLAESDNTLFFDNNHYFPPEALRREFFRDSGHHTECGWKGTASYYSVVVETSASWATKVWPQCLQATCWPSSSGRTRRSAR